VNLWLGQGGRPDRARERPAGPGCEGGRRGWSSDYGRRRGFFKPGQGAPVPFGRQWGRKTMKFDSAFKGNGFSGGGGAPSPSRLRCPKRPSESPRQAGEGQGRPPASGGPDLSSPACRRSSRSPHAGGPEPDTVRRADCGWRDGGDPARPAAPEPDAPCRRAVRKCPAPGGGGSARSGHRPFTLSA